MIIQKRFAVIDNAGKIELTDCKTIEEVYVYVDEVYTGGPIQGVTELPFYDITNRPPGF